MIQGIKLKRCPFCGGNGVYTERDVMIGHNEYVHESYIRCSECGAEGRRCADVEYGVCAAIMAVDFWNKRKIINLKLKTKTQ